MQSVLKDGWKKNVHTPRKSRSVIVANPSFREMRAACLLDAGESDQDASDRCRRVHVLVAAALRDTSTSLLRTGNRHVQPRVLLSSSSQSIAALSAPHKNGFFVIAPIAYSFVRQRSNAEMSATDFAARRTRVYSAVYVMACSVRACPSVCPLLVCFPPVANISHRTCIRLSDTFWVSAWSSLRVPIDYRPALINNVICSAVSIQ